MLFGWKNISSNYTIKVDQTELKIHQKISEYKELKSLFKYDQPHSPTYHSKRKLVKGDSWLLTEVYSHSNQCKGQVDQGQDVMQPEPLIIPNMEHSK